MAMAKTGIVTLALVVLISATWPGSLAQTSSSCTNVLISMSPCLNYITGNSSTPSSSCCSQLASVVKSDPQCLCQVISGGGSSASSLGININQTQALQLPSACNVQTPSISRCTSTASPSATTSPSSDNSGSTTTPTTTTSTTGSTGGSSVDTSEGHSIKLGLAMFVPLFFIANFARDFLVNI